MRLRVRWLAFALCPLSLSAQPSPKQVVVEATKLVQKARDEGGFQGAVLVASRGKILARMATGNAIENWRLPNTPETRFEIASLTKQFTAAAVLQLAERGKLALSNAVAKWCAAWLAGDHD